MPAAENQVGKDREGKMKRSQNPFDNISSASSMTSILSFFVFKCRRLIMS